MGYRKKFKELFTLTAIYVGEDIRVRTKVPVQPTKLVIPALVKDLVAAGYVNGEDVLRALRKAK